MRKDKTQTIGERKIMKDSQRQKVEDSKKAKEAAHSDRKKTVKAVISRR